MKISVLTPTYNRGEFLKKLYNSLLENSNYDVEIEWLIMDDGSKDNTRKIVEQFKQNNKIDIKYYYQENQGKMVAINQLVKNATGEMLIDCDSDDYFLPNAFKIIKKEFEKNKNEKNVYGLCFLKYNQKQENIGKLFKYKRNTMFDLYFKQGEDGEKAIVFYTNIRKKYEHKLERQEKFITEARMYHQMDLDNQMICINEPIMVCEYQKDGYTKNIAKQFKENPYGYLEYFKEILQREDKNMLFKKRLYVIKHYILFSYITRQYQSNIIKNWKNKILYYILLLPGILKTKKYVGGKEDNEANV